MSKENTQVLKQRREKADLLAFLLTLNDKTFVFNPKHQYPRDILMPSEGL